MGPGLGPTSMQIVRDARIKKTNGNGGNLYGDTFMAVAELVEMLVEPYDNMTRGCKEPIRILHENPHWFHRNLLQPRLHPKGQGSFFNSKRQNY